MKDHKGYTKHIQINVFFENEVLLLLSGIVLPGKIKR